MRFFFSFMTFSTWVLEYWDGVCVALSYLGCCSYDHINVLTEILAHWCHKLNKVFLYFLGGWYGHRGWRHLTIGELCHYQRGPWGTILRYAVEPRNRVCKRIIWIMISLLKSDLQNSAKPRNSGYFLGYQSVRYWEVILYYHCDILKYLAYFVDFSLWSFWSSYRRMY